MTHWLLALVLALASLSPAFAQEEGGEGGEGGGEQQMSEGQEGGDQGEGGEQSGGDQGEGGGQQQDGEQGGGQQGEGEVSVEPVESSGGGSNIVGDIAADDGEEEMPAPRPKARKAKISNKKAPAVKAAKATKARLSRRRRAAANPVGTQTAPSADAEPQFPELDLPELKEAVAKKEPAPPTAPLVPMPLMFP